MQATRRSRVRTGLIGAGLAALLAAAPAAATNPLGGLPNFQALPDVSPPAQVNSDLADGIDPARYAFSADLVAGATTAGKVPVPWVTFDTDEPASNQVFVRAFKGGSWQTQGAPPSAGAFASLNFDQHADAGEPAIDFTGAGRTVPWVAWEESNSAFGFTQIFASRFVANAQQQNGGAWQIEGQGRVPADVPSLNIHTNENATNPAIAGGATAAGANPAPWIAWQEHDNNGSTSTGTRIFVSKGPPNPAGQGQACTGDKPAATPSVSLFCFQQTGVERVGPTNDPSLNVDPKRTGIEPDITFTGPGDTVPWVVWYEMGTGGTGLANNELVFAAKGVVPGATTPPETGAVDGAIQWEAVGKSTTAPAVLDAGAGAGACGLNITNERNCALNHDPTMDAEDPQVAVGTMTPGANTVPWVVWDEQLPGGNTGIFVARLDSSGNNFDLLNGGNPISNPNNDAVTGDIVFDGNTPYVTWTEDEGAAEKVFVAHFENAASPVLVLDTPVVGSNAGGIALSAIGSIGVRAPIASSCAPNSTDANACPAGALGTPFFAFLDGTGPSKLFAGAFSPPSATTGGATGVTSSSAGVAAAVSPGGAQVGLQVQFGTDTGYGLGASALQIVPALGQSLESAAATAQSLTALPASTTIHYRAHAVTDFATVDGNDAIFATSAAPIPPTNNNPGGGSQPAPPPPATISLVTQNATVNASGKLTLALRCNGASGQSCGGTVALSTRVKKTVRHGHRKRTVITTVTIAGAPFAVPAGATGNVALQLNAAGLASLIAAKGSLQTPVKLTLTGTTTPVTGNVTLKLHVPKHKKHKHGHGR